MRNWNIVWQFLESLIRLFSSYLWGIETIHHSSPPFPHICFHLTYEELKPVLSDPFNSDMFSVFILPMRNWNLDTYMGRYALSKFSSYLWGIETEQHSFFQPFLQPFSSYLWGIETAQPFAGSWCASLFSSYLWGIETEFVDVTCPLCHGFHLTYEELKPVTGKSQTGTSAPTFSSYLWGIETRCVLFRDNSARTVFILPMRNWNISRQPKSLWMWKFSSYLWGIETTVPAGLYWNTSKFSSYLWGIETVCTTSFIIPPPRFHLTYEELKLRSVDKYGKVH